MGRLQRHFLSSYRTFISCSPSLFPSLSLFLCLSFIFPRLDASVLRLATGTVFRVGGVSAEFTEGYRLCILPFWIFDMGGWVGLGIVWLEATAGNLCIKHHVAFVE